MTKKQFGMLAPALAAMFAFGSFAAQPAAAQGKKILSTVERRQHPGNGFWANDRASRNIQHARDYSRSIGRYTTQATTINPAVTKAESEMLGMQIQGVQRDMGIVRESHIDNPQIAKQVKVIDDKLAKASETQKMLHKECCKDTPDGKFCGDMAKKLTKALNEISKDHAKLMEMTGDDKHQGHEATKAEE